MLKTSKVVHSLKHSEYLNSLAVKQPYMQRFFGNAKVFVQLAFDYVRQMLLLCWQAN